MWVHLSPLYLRLQPFTPPPPLSRSFIPFFSHCLFFCPRLNSDSFCESSPTPHLLPNEVAMVTTGFSVSRVGAFFRLCVCTIQCPGQMSYQQDWGQSLWPASSALIPGAGGASDTLTLSTGILRLYALLFNPPPHSHDYQYIGLYVARLDPGQCSRSRGRPTSRHSRQNSVVSSHISPGHR